MLSDGSAPNRENARAIDSGAMPRADRDERRAGEVRHVVARAAADGQGHGGNVAEIAVHLAPAQHQAAVANAAGRPAAVPVLLQKCSIRIESEPSDRRAPSEALGQAASLRAQLRVVGIEHQQTAGRHGARHRQLHVREPAEVVDAPLAEVVGTHVRDDGGVGAAHRDASPQYSAARSLEHGAAHA